MFTFAKRSGVDSYDIVPFVLNSLAICFFFTVIELV